MTDVPSRPVNANERLLSCPFCGPGQSMVDAYFDEMAKRYRVGCGRCGSSSGIHPRETGPEPAIAAWNKRGTSELLAALEALVADVLDYEKINNLSPGRGRKYCWDSVERAVNAIANATDC